MKCAQKSSPTRKKHTMLRAEMKFDFPPMHLFRGVCLLDHRLESDKAVKSMAYLERVGVNLLLAYQVNKRVLTISERDLYMHQYCDIDDDGNLYTFVSDEFCKDCPDEKGCVRMDIPLGGYVIKPDKSDPNKCTLFALFEVDPMGNIP